ncbi:4Fe-4S dicluster domain-containing protein [uncultured Tessaracoccus sp.]|uniref:4Fe-4S dicluster domain-containing protein n=1 Tax=uncultured Tessaracoccus sp. TaxID=905023 RepID=UPI002614310C|nr:4Fe-4S dicluster domain-containing protein [uncultured Tessaracoccus sp.]
MWLAVGEKAALPGVVVEDGCTACGGCAHVCPMQALTQSGDRLTLAPDRCVDCGECVRVCPEGVARRAPRQPGRQARVLVEIEATHCDRCARTLGPGEQGMCHGCATKASLADGIWEILGDSG